MADLQEADLQYYYYHWFWGLSKVKKDQSPPPDNMQVLTSPLIQDLSQQLSLEAQVLSIEKKNRFIYFFYWLFNIDNFSLNKHKLSIVKAMTKNNAGENLMNSIRPPKSTDQEQRDIVDEVQFILLGGYDDQDTLTFAPLSKYEFCDNLHHMIYDVLQSKQFLIAPTGILQSLNGYFSISHEGREKLKKYHSRFYKVLQLLEKEVYPLGPSWRNLTFSPSLPKLNRPLADSIVAEVNFLLIETLRSMLSEMPWHKELTTFLLKHDAHEKEMEQYRQPRLEGQLRVTIKMRNDLKIMDLLIEVALLRQNRQNELEGKILAKKVKEDLIEGEKIRHKWIAFEEIKKAYRNTALIHHPDKGGDSKYFKLLKETFTNLTQELDSQNKQDQISNLQILWAKKQKKLEDEMDTARLEPALRIAIWKNILKPGEKYGRDDNNEDDYILGLEARIANIQAGIDYLNWLIAIKTNEQDAIEFLLSAGNPDVGLLSYFTLPPDCILKEDYKPLFLALRLTDPAIFKMLLDADANVFIKDIFGYSVAERIGVSRFWATEIKKEMLSTLSERGVSLPAILQAACLGDSEALMEKSKEELNVVDSFNNTVLHYAAANGHTELCKSLYESDNTLITKKNKHGFTPIMWAVLNGHIAVVELLLSYGATLDEQTKKGTSTIKLARTDEMRAFLNSRNSSSPSPWRSFLNGTSHPVYSAMRNSLFAYQSRDTTLEKASQPPSTSAIPLSPTPAVGGFGGGG